MGNINSSAQGIVNILNGTNYINEFKNFNNDIARLTYIEKYVKKEHIYNEYVTSTSFTINEGKVDFLDILNIKESFDSLIQKLNESKNIHKQFDQFKYTIKPVISSSPGNTFSIIATIDRLETNEEYFKRINDILDVVKIMLNIDKNSLNETK